MFFSCGYFAQNSMQCVKGKHQSVSLYYSLIKSLLSQQQADMIVTHKEKN